MKTLHNNFIGTQAEIEDIDAFEGMIAYATDLNLLGTFNGSSWNWFDSAGVLDISARVHRSTDQTINSGSWIALSFDAENWDTDNIWTSGSPTELVCRTPGKYIIHGHIMWDTDSTGNRGIAVRLNGTDYIGSHRNLASTSSYSLQNISCIYNLEAGDYVELMGHQNSGTTLDSKSDSMSPSFSMTRIGAGESELDLIANGRLTLTSGSPVTTSDVTAATSVYFTPYLGNRISLYNGASWKKHQFTERTLSLSGFAADTNFDIFLYNNSGTLTLEAVAWTDGTTRATALAVQDGVYVKSGDSTRRYLGTIRTTGTIGQCEDSYTKRYCWNYYNQIMKMLNKNDGTDHTYGTTTWRYYNNDSSNKVEIVVGLDESSIVGSILNDVEANTYQAWLGVGVDSSSTATNPTVLSASDARQIIGGVWSRFLSEGYHYLSILQYASNSCDWKGGAIQLTCLM